MTTATKTRKCPVTNEKFEAKTEEHFFGSKEAFDLFIDEIDPMKEFTVSTRKINWDPIERACSECGDMFDAVHPAMMYCTDCKDNEAVEEKEKKPKDGRNPIAHYEPRVKHCDDCGSEFLALKPAMRYCEKCSVRGGPRVNG